MSTRIASLVLSGGQSSRMGQDKALLSFDHRSLLDRQVELLTGLHYPVWVSGLYPQYPHISDQSRAKGPLAGIASSMRYLQDQADFLFIIAVDMPLLSADLLTFLLQQMQGEQACYVAQSIFPIWLPNTPDNRASIEKAESSHDYALKPFLRAIEAKVISCQQMSLLTNTNTPEQWRDAMTHIKENH
ncbi:molybdenum cofactor guanylyltransferase [Celerinatantimonas sp. YJH-8]|uniref:molybdenum cofactor guanylyltransferase n=1 Tax=Celerinatantimonas sp. YJH-8 TaxID=3228714 RepID=UPI0038BE4880